MTQQEIDYIVEQILDLIEKTKQATTSEMKGFYMNSIYIVIKDFWYVEDGVTPGMIYKSMTEKMDAETRDSFFNITDSIFKLFKPS